MERGKVEGGKEWELNLKEVGCFDGAGCFKEDDDPRRQAFVLKELSAYVRLLAKLFVLSLVFVC